MNWNTFIKWIFFFFFKKRLMVLFGAFFQSEVRHARNLVTMRIARANACLLTSKAYCGQLVLTPRKSVCKIAAPHSPRNSVS